MNIIKLDAKDYFVYSLKDTNQIVAVKNNYENMSKIETIWHQYGGRNFVPESEDATIEGFIVDKDINGNYSKVCEKLKSNIKISDLR